MKRFEIPWDIEKVKIERVEFTQTHEIIITVTSTLESISVIVVVKKFMILMGIVERLTDAIYRF